MCWRCTTPFGRPVEPRAVEPEAAIVTRRVRRRQFLPGGSRDLLEAQLVGGSLPDDDQVPQIAALVTDPAKSIRHGFTHDRYLRPAVVEQVGVLVRGQVGIDGHGTAPSLIVPKNVAANSGESRTAISTRFSISTPSSRKAFPARLALAATSAYVQSPACVLIATLWERPCSRLPSSRSVVAL